MYGFTVQLPLRKYKYYMLSITLFASIIVYFCKTKTPPYSSKIVCSIKGPLSLYGYTTIKSFIKQHQEFGIKSLNIIQNLQKTFPWIKDIHLTITPQCQSISITMHTSLIAINNQWLITQTGSFFEKKFYKDSYYRDIPSITYNKNMLSNKKSLIDLYDYIQKIPREVFNFYTIVWENSNLIYFFDRNNKNFKIITSTEKHLTHQHLADYLRIKGMLYTNNVAKKMNSWIADLRFSNYIIIAKEGSNYGSTLF